MAMIRLRFEYIILAAIPFLLFFLYSPALNGPFLFDDIANIEKNSSIHIKNISLESLKTAAGGHRPVATISFALNYYVSGLSPYWFRVVNIAIHISTAWILYFFICKTLFLSEKNYGNNRLFATISALIWAVHPLQIQSVTYIVQRMNSLAGLFFLLAMLAYIEFRPSDANIKKILMLTAFCISVILSIKSKPNAITIFPSILLYEFIFIKKIKLNNYKNIFAFSLLFFSAFLLLYFASRDAASPVPFANLSAWYHGKGFTLTQYLMTEFRVLVFYISLIFFPHPSRLNIDHDIYFSKSLFQPETTFLSLLFLMTAIILSFLYVKKYKILTFGILWFFTNHLVESTIIPLDFIFEHRNYIPSMMLIFGFLSVLTICNKRIFMLAAISIAAILSIWTFQRNSVWKSGIALWEDSSLKSAKKSRPHENFAYYLEQEGRVKESVEFYKESVELYPNNPRYAAIESHIGDLLAKQGDMRNAFEHYSKAFAVNPKSKELLNSLGNFFYRMGDFEKASSFYKQALKIEKKSVILNINIGNAMTALGDIDAAFKYYNSALSLDKTNIEANYNFALLLMQKGDITEAADMLKYVLTLNPRLKEAHSTLGMICEQLNQRDEAIKNYSYALEIDKNFKHARENLDRLIKPGQQSQ
jgi:tetratricopeptide (TPR) repeat protein